MATWTAAEGSRPGPQFPSPWPSRVSGHWLAGLWHAIDDFLGFLAEGLLERF